MAREDLIICDPDIRSGIPTIKGTRIGAHEAAILAANDTRENVFKAFPRLTEEMLEAAIEYHRRAIADASSEDEEGGARGRNAEDTQSSAVRRLVRSTKVRFPGP